MKLLKYFKSKGDTWYQILRKISNFKSLKKKKKILATSNISRYSKKWTRMLDTTFQLLKNLSKSIR